MRSRDRIGSSEFISDRSALSQVELEIDTSAEPLFVNLVTMQNHYPMAGIYPDNVPVTGIYGDEAAQAGGYARGLAHSDTAMDAFLHHLRSSNEKTAVIFYGDHLPGVLAPADPRPQRPKTNARDSILHLDQLQETCPPEIADDEPSVLLAHAIRRAERPIASLL